MNCTNVRERLPELLYESLSLAEAEKLNDHLAHCLACKSEFASLQDLQRTLDSVRAPDESVHLPTLYRCIADLHQKKTKRWRRTALSMAGIAAAVIVVIAFRLEIRLDMDKLSREVETRDRRQQQAIGRLQENLAQVRIIMQRQLNARQVVLDSSNKGEDQ